MALFKLEEDTTETNSGADMAVPDTHNGVVNVVLDHSWTLSPKSSRKDVPYIYMVERKVTNDVMLQQLLYNITAVYQAGGEITDTVGDALKKSAINSINNSTLSTKQKSDAIAALNSKPKDKESPYAGLYALDDTGWEFIFPYFDKQNHNVGSNWGTPEGGGGISKGLAAVGEGIAGFGEDLNKVMSFFETANQATGMDLNMKANVGTYIERAKQYKFGDSGPSYSLTFNLFNTTTIEDIIKNWELCFLLIYNNLPNRRTKTTFDPPPLYEIEIPGVRKSPVSWIRGLKVDFVGATRIMDLDLSGSIGNSKFRTIVPDAYKVTIDIQDVFQESKNFMNAMVNPDRNISVTFGGDTTSKDFVSVEQTYKDANITTNGNEISYISINKERSNNRSGIAKNAQDGFANGSIGKAFSNVKSSVGEAVTNASSAVRGLF
jgi:hypothetical protein